MGEVLDRIMESSRKGYIGSWDKIDKILGEIAALSLRDMSAMLGKDAAETGKMIAESLLNEEHGLGLEPDVIEAVRLMEILCLVDGAKNVLDDRGFHEEQEALNSRYIRRKEPYWYTCINLLLHIFREAQKKDALFRQFWCIGLEDLMDGLDTLDYVRHPMEERKAKFYRRVSKLQISLNSGITIGETLEQAREVTWEMWRPSESIYAYAGRILTAFKIIEFLLVDSFRFRDPEHFCLDSILEKYGKLPDSGEE